MTPTPTSGGSVGPDLQLSKYSDKTVITRGEVATYTLYYENKAGTISTGVAITEEVPIGTVYEPSANVDGWVCNGLIAGSTCRLDIGTLNPDGLEHHVKFAVRTLSERSNRVVVVNVANIGDDGQHGQDRHFANNSDRAIVVVLDKKK